MVSSNTPSLRTRRSVLAACGTAMLAGCSDILAPDSPPPSIECTHTTYDWPMYGYDAARTSHVRSHDLPLAAEASRFSQTGTHSGGGSADAPPVINDGVAYVAGSVRIEARDIETGARLWESEPEDGIETSPVLACGTVYVSTVNETLAFDPEDGTELWRADAGTHFGVSSSPVAVGDTVYVVGVGVTALDAETGTKRWHAQIEHSALGVAIDDHIYVGAGSNGSGEVAAFTRDGDDLWRTTAAGQVYSATSVVGDTVYAISKTGVLTALAVADGSVRWEASVEHGINEPPAVANGRVVVSAGNENRTMAFNAATGNRLWTFETGVSTGAPVITGDRVLATGANTGIHVLDVGTGNRVHHWPIENVGSQPVIAGRRLFYRGWDVSDVFVIES